MVAAVLDVVVAATVGVVVYWENIVCLFDYLFHVRPSDFCNIFKVIHVRDALIMT